MKRIFSIIVLGTYLLFSLAGCKGEVINNSNANEVFKLNIIATTYPQYDFAKKIVGDKADVTLLLSPGLETHSFEPSPKDRIDIANCDVFIYTGGEPWVEKVLESTDVEDIKSISLMDIVSLVEEEIVEGMDHGHEHHDEHHEEHNDVHDGEHHDDKDMEYDEHVWTSPKNAMKIVEYLSSELTMLDKDNEDHFKANAQDYLEELEALDQLFVDITQGAKSDTILVADRFPFRYLTEEYGLKYYAAFTGCSTQTDPSPATLAFLIDTVRENEIPVVFYTEQSNQKMADTICESTNSKKMLLHSCHNITKEEIEEGVTYTTLMTQNAENLMEALK